MTLKRYIFFFALTLPALASFAQDYNNIEFVENKGQWDNRVKFKGNVSSGAFFIRSTGFTVLQHDPNDMQAFYDMIHGHKEAGKDKIINSHSYWVDFVGASANLEVVPEKIISSYNNYFIGNDPSKWAGGCKIYLAVVVKNVYNNVDVRYYTDNGSLKYDIIARPGADISQIALQYRGVDRMQVKNKELKVATSIGELKETLPYSYQSVGKERTEVSCKYVLKDNIVRFDVKNYDPASTLIIDPSLIFCSFVGSKANMWGFTATYGPDGSAFGGGIIFDNDVFPFSPGAFQSSHQGGNNTGVSNAPIDIGIMKLSSNGSTRLYATYLGGNGNEQPHSLVVDPQGNVIIAGRTNSTNYPGGLIGPGGDWDITVTKFNASGTALIGSQRIGGSGMDGANITAGSDGVSSLQQNYGDDGRSEVILDGANNIYVASCVQSLNFPTNNGFQTSFGGGLQDGVLIKLNANVSSLLFSSYLGGGGNDAAYVLSLGPTGDIYVGGGTESNNFPGDHTSTIHSTLQGGIDGFLARVTNNGSAIIKSTYLGTSGIDQVFGVQFDKNGFPYVMGQTTGAWPVVNATYANPGSKQFIAKLQPDLSNWVYSTVFGTGAAIPNISPVAFLVDRCENVYVSGWGGLIVPTQPGYYPSAGTSGMPTTPDAIKLNSPDNADFYFFVLKKDATTILYGSFFGQDGGAVLDHVDGGTSRFDQTGVIYQAICANCGGGATFPATPGAWATTKPPSAYCNLAVVKIAFNLAGVLGNIKSAINGVPRDTAGCVPLTVDFTDTVGIAANYEWNFGDGSPVLTTTLPSATHTFNAVGNYQVMLIAIDPATCNVRDTSYVHIRVGDLIGNIDFSITKLPPCDSFKYQFDNLSIAPAIRPYGSQSFLWDFGDGSPRITAGMTSVFHNYAGPGTYNVKLILVDTNYCNAPDSMTIQLRVAANVKAQFTTPPTGCTPYNAVFTNTSLAGASFEWTFGDGGTSTAVSPTHLYTSAGTYNIMLVANDPNTCNLTDTARFTISVFDNPVADYFYTPDPPVENTPTTFTNTSSLDANIFRWDFGDGDTLLTTSRLPVQHQYNATGTFNACLTVYNAAGCPDSVCRQVKTLINPLVDVPNAFTPQSGDINSVILVRGFGIAKMQFIIWNRWGQKVFETGNRLQGWDGRVKGVLQPMDVYAYTLEVEFFDGTKATKRGDITLIR